MFRRIICTIAPLALLMAGIAIALDVSKADARPASAVSKVGIGYFQTAHPKRVAHVHYEPGDHLLFVQRRDMSVSIYKPCRTEDERNCYWDSMRHGNGEGRSFINTRGKIKYIPIRAWTRWADRLGLAPHMIID